MAVVMLSENCRCNNDYADMIRYANPGAFCGCLMADNAPLLSKNRFFNWLDEKFGRQSGFCPACHNVVDNIGDTFTNLAGFVEQVPNYAGYLVGSAVQGVGGFIANPQNIPCIAGAVGAAYGMPLGLGGCTPAGFNQQFQTMETQPEPINPLILYGGIGLLAVLLLK